MKKYAMIPINGKENEKGQPIIRRVLISYKTSIQKNGQVFYSGTKIIDRDPYFLEKRSHTYTFKDDYYTLDKMNDINSIFTSGIVNVKRKYHYNISKDPLQPAAIEFEASTEEEAKKKFHNRKELRD